jgi:tetratricopeptide (TPR) repeat protein
VETTCPRWFQLRDDPKTQAQLLARVRGNRPGAERAPAREVTPIQMTAMIYYNRGIDLLAGRQFPEALAANAKALRLDPASATARGNLLATINNWSIRLGEAEQFAEAASRLEAGLSLAPDYQAFAANYAHVHYQWVHALCHAKRFAEAVAVLERAIECRPNEAYFRRALGDVHRRWATQVFATATREDALAVFDAAYRRLGRQPTLVAAELAATNDYALTLIEQGRFPQALATLDQALARLPDATLLDENRRVAVMRWAEPAFHEGDYAEAIRRTTYGARPGQLHASLVNNVRYGYQQWLAKLKSDGLADEAQRVAQLAKHDPFLAGQ